MNLTFIPCAYSFYDYNYNYYYISFTSFYKLRTRIISSNKIKRENQTRIELLKYKLYNE